MRKSALFFSSLLLLSSCTSHPPQKTTPEEPPAQTQKTPFRPESKQEIFIPRGIDFSKAPEVIAVGSCADQNQPQIFWESIQAQKPNLFLFIGDNIYASRPEQRPFRREYQKLNDQPAFRAFRKEVPIMAIWDDHDYGLNDGGADNPEKDEARAEFLRQWPYVRDSISLTQGGLYHVKYIGGEVEGRRRKKRVTGPTTQVIMLDTRWYRSPLKKSDSQDPLRKYEPHTDKKTTLLGQEQWEWLEQQLKRPADLRILVSSIQVLADGHGFEKWGLFPHEKERLFHLLKKTGVKNLILVSGDRHLSAISKVDIPGYGPLYELTASSLNRPGTLIESDPVYLHNPAITQSNFGLIKVNYKSRKLEMQILSTDQTLLQSHTIRF
ncbi:MAG: alkaline phosphatase family protein [Bdellovibrionaceae bacterium]|nr:alkaline phosphatase family protein [Pseudobdellovibrionaceae bacterium]